jgi:acyl carrier protein
VALVILQPKNTRWLMVSLAPHRSSSIALRCIVATSGLSDDQGLMCDVIFRATRDMTLDNVPFQLAVLLYMSDSISKPEIIAILKNIIAEKIKPGLEAQNLETTIPLLDGGLGLDSIMIVDLIMAVEQQFSFHFAEDDLSLDSFASLDALAQVIARREVECSLAT